MSDVHTQPAPIDTARDQFFGPQRHPALGIAPHIWRSWERSKRLGGDVVDPAPLALARLGELREQQMLLLQCAQPELDGLAEHVIGNGCVIVLAEASGLILEAIGSPDFLPKDERVALTPGVDWSEGNRGTNAIGTALAEREALMVLGKEHYLPENAMLGCAAAPILSGRGEVVGVLDISGEAVRVNPHALGLVRMAAQQVEHRMVLAEARGHVLRFHRRPALLGTAREGLMVIEEGRIVAANRVALALLDSSWERLLDRRLEPLLGAQWGRLERQRGLLTLPGGQQIAAVKERVAGSSTATRRPAVAATVDEPSEQDADAVQPLLDKAVRVLDQGVAVVVTGETGVGKEVFARRLHAASRRRGGPFIAVNCAALPETLIEAELFGYDDGAFTGARRRGMPGRIREAHGGVLFLDEIADMPLALQTRLLRVLEERVVTALGGGAGVAVDVDIVCATHGDLRALSSAGRFRPDLFYRVAGFTVALPPLRQRPDREALIARLFADCGGSAKGLRLSASAMERLLGYRWPGNVRELRSVLRSVAALAEPGDGIDAADLPPEVRDASASAPGGAARAPNDAGDDVRALADLTWTAIERTLEECGQNVAEAARRLGVHRSTVYRHLARPQRGGHRGR